MRIKFSVEAIAVQLPQDIRAVDDVGVVRGKTGQWLVSSDYGHEVVNNLAKLGAEILSIEDGPEEAKLLAEAIEGHL